MFGNEIIILKDQSYLSADFLYVAIALLMVGSMVTVLCILLAIMEHRYGIRYLRNNKWVTHKLYIELSKIESRPEIINPTAAKRLTNYIRYSFDELGRVITLKFMSMHDYLRLGYIVQLVLSVFLVIVTIFSLIFLPQVKHQYIVKFATEQIPIEFLESWSIEDLGDGTYKITEKGMIIK